MKYVYDSKRLLKNGPEEITQEELDIINNAVLE